MSLPTSIGAYKEEIEVLERAIDSRSGIRVPVADLGAATHFRMRLHQARQIDRKKNAQTYIDHDHPLHNSSIYDPLVVTIGHDSGRYFVYLKRSQYVMGQIEELEEGEDIDLIAQEPPPQIEHQPIEELEDDFAPAIPAPSGFRRRI